MNKKLAILLTCLITPLTLTACNKNNNKITVAEVTRSIFYAPMYVALNEGYFKDEGLDVTLITTPGSDKTMSALLSKEAQIGLMGPETTIYVYNNGQKDYAVNFAQLTQKDGSFLVSREYYEYGNFDFDKLIGASIIGGRKGGMPEMILEYVLKNMGYEVSHDDENAQIYIRTDINFDVMAGAFASGNDDFVTLFEPSATAMENINEGYIVASIGELGGNIPYTCFSSLQSYFAKNETQIKQFTKAMKKGLEYVYSHSSEEIAQVIYKSFPSTDVETISKVVERYKSIDAWTSDLRFSEEGFNKLQDVLKEANELSKRVPYEKVVTNKYV